MRRRTSPREMGTALKRTRSSCVALTWFVTPHPYSRVDGFLASQSARLTYENPRSFHPRPPVLEHAPCQIGRDAHRLANTDRQPGKIAERLTEGTAQVTACHFIPSALAGTGSVVTFRIFNIFRVRYCGQQNGEQGLGSRDPNEVLEHGDSILCQRGLISSNIDPIFTWAVRLLKCFISQAGEDPSPNAFPHHSRRADQN